MKLTLIALMSLILAGILCYFTLRLSERIAEATMPRIEIALNQ